MRRLQTLVPLFVLGPGLYALVASERIQMSFHGWLHSAYVYQIDGGALPPDNPLMPGTGANEYWLWHALVSGLGSLLGGTAPPQAAGLLNVAALIVSIWATGRLIAHLGLRPQNELSAGVAVCFVLFGANLMGVVHGLMDGFGGMGSSRFPELGPLLLHGSDRSAGLFAKFLNFNGFPVGVSFFLIALAGGVSMLTKGAARGRLIVFLVGLFGAMAFHAATGIFAVAVLPVAVVTAWFLTRPRPKWLLTGTETAIIFGSGAVLFGALVYYLISIAAAFDVGVRVTLMSGDNWLRTFGVLYPLLPLFVWGAVASARRRDPGFVMLTIVALGGVAMALALELPGENQYKFDYLAGIPMGLISLHALSEWKGTPGWPRKSALAVAATGAALVLANQVAIGVAYLSSDWFGEDSIVYEGNSVVSMGPRGAEWRWIDDNTPYDAILVAPLTGKDRARFLAITRRLPYVVRGGPLTAGSEEFLDRVEAIQRFYGRGIITHNPDSVFTKLAADLGDRPVIVVAVPGSEGSDQARSLGLRKLHATNDLEVYEPGRD